MEHYPYPPGASALMVPDDPESALICRYQTLTGGTLARAAKVSGKDSTSLASELDAVPGIPPGGVFNCPADIGSVALIFFIYADQKASTVLVNLTGCPSATNGSDSKLFTEDAWLPGKKVLDHLDQLVGHERF